MLTVSPCNTERKWGRENGKSMKKTKEIKKEVKLGADVGVREGVKAAGVSGVAVSRCGSSSDSGRRQECTSSTCVSFPAWRPVTAGWSL